MDREHKIIGFDRKIRLSWLDATADWAAQGLPAAAIRTRLDRLLDGQVAGNGPHSARGKNMTVLMHVWVLVPRTLVQLRNEGLNLLDNRFGRDRLPLHWGMCLATYPFFRDVAATTGRLLRPARARGPLADYTANDRDVGVPHHRGPRNPARGTVIRGMGTCSGRRVSEESSDLR